MYDKVWSRECPSLPEDVGDYDYCSDIPAQLMHHPLQIVSSPAFAAIPLTTHEQSWSNSLNLIAHVLLLEWTVYGLQLTRTSSRISNMPRPWHKADSINLYSLQTTRESLWGCFTRSPYVGFESWPLLLCNSSWVLTGYTRTTWCFRRLMPGKSS